MPDGHALLTSPDQLSEHNYAALQEAFAEWRRRDGGVLFLSSTQIKVVKDIELEVEMADQGQKSPMQNTANQAQKTMNENARRQETPNARDNAEAIGKGEKSGKTR